MARHGFAYSEQLPPALAEKEIPSIREFPYVVDDLEWARTYGYGDLVSARGSAARDGNNAVVGKLSPEQQQRWQHTLMGSGRELSVDIPDLGRVQAPDNGCTAEARRTLYGDLAGWYRVRRVVDHLDVYVRNAVTRDPLYRRGLAAWATCVREQGYAASSPYELRALVAREITTPTPDPALRQREIAAAETEAGCARTAELPRTVQSLDRKVRPAVERRFARERQALDAFEQKAIPVARAVLADA